MYLYRDISEPTKMSPADKLALTELRWATRLKFDSYAIRYTYVDIDGIVKPAKIYAHPLRKLKHPELVVLQLVEYDHS